jgi:segregation and condensation protein A
VSHTVSVGEFKGPLGILLELVEQGNFEVTAISVANITAEYLERVKHIQDQSPETVSEFLQLGARLLYIKSLALLPEDTPGEQGEELRRLNLELEEYRKFQLLARELAARAQERTWERPAAPKLSTAELPPPRLTLPQLAEAFTAALERVQATPEPTVIPRHISQAAVLAGLRRRLPSGFALDSVLADCQTRLEVIVTFLALLELIREDEAKAGQSHQFGPIQVEAAHG